MLMYDNKRGMHKCLFLEDDWTCDTCDFRLNGTCKEGFFKKYGRLKDEDSN